MNPKDHSQIYKSVHQDGALVFEFPLANWSKPIEAVGFPKDCPPPPPAM